MSREVVLYVAVSLDGFIADQDGGVGWLDSFASDPDTDYGYRDFYDTVDTTVMGRRTYDQILGFGVDFPYVDKENYVFRSGPLESRLATRVVSDPAAFVASMKRKPGRSIWLVGGGRLNAGFHAADLIDRTIITIIPVTLGAGVRLFEGSSHRSAWTLANQEVFDSGVVQLTHVRDGGG